MRREFSKRFIFVTVLVVSFHPVHCSPLIALQLVFLFTFYFSYFLPFISQLIHLIYTFLINYLFIYLLTIWGFEFMGRKAYSSSIIFTLLFIGFSSCFPSLSLVMSFFNICKYFFFIYLPIFEGCGLMFTRLHKCFTSHLYTFQLFQVSLLFLSVFSNIFLLLSTLTKSLSLWVSF